MSTLRSGKSPYTSIPLVNSSPAAPYSYGGPAMLRSRAQSPMVRSGFEVTPPSATSAAGSQFISSQRRPLSTSRNNLNQMRGQSNYNESAHAAQPGASSTTFNSRIIRSQQPPLPPSNVLRRVSFQQQQQSLDHLQEFQSRYIFLCLVSPKSKIFAFTVNFLYNLNKIQWDPYYHKMSNLF